MECPDQGGGEERRIEDAVGPTDPHRQGDQDREQADEQEDHPRHAEVAERLEVDGVRVDDPEVPVAFLRPDLAIGPRAGAEEWVVAEVFERQFPLDHAAVAVQRGEPVLQFARVFARLRFGEAFVAVGDLARRVERGPGDQHDDQGTGAGGDPALAHPAWRDLDPIEATVERRQQHPQGGGADRTGGQLPGQGVAFGDAERSRVVAGRERVGTDAKKDRDGGRWGDRDDRRDQLAAGGEQDEGDDPDCQGDDRPAREGEVKGRDEKRDRARGKCLADQRLLAPGGESEGDRDRHRGEDPDRVPVGKWVAQARVFEHASGRVDLRQDTGDEPDDSDRKHRRGQDPHRPDQSLPGPAEGTEEDQRQPVHQRPVEFDHRLRRGVRPESRDERPKRVEAERRGSGDERRAETLEGPLGKDDPQHQGDPEDDGDDRRGTGKEAAGAEGQVGGDRSRAADGEDAGHNCRRRRPEGGVPCDDRRRGRGARRPADRLVSSLRKNDPGYVVLPRPATPRWAARENKEMSDFTDDRSAWLRCYRCWSQNLEIQIHYDAIRRVDPATGELAEGVDEVQESVVQCLDCMHDQPHLTFEDDRVAPIGERWPRMVAGTPWVASCTVQIDAERVESCSGPEAAEFLTYGAFGDAGVREFFTHVRFHKHDEDQIVVHLLVELYARSAQEATEVLEEAAEGVLEITSLAEESRPPAHASGEAH